MNTTFNHVRDAIRSFLVTLLLLTINFTFAQEEKANTTLQPESTLPGIIERVSISSSGAQGNNWSGEGGISADGRYVVFCSPASNLVTGDTNGKQDIFVRDRLSGQTSRVSVAGNGEEGNGDSRWPSISANGRYIVFYSQASNLVEGDTNSAWDVFVRDRQGGQTSRVSIATGGLEGNGTSVDPVISSDGRFVAFESDATNLVSGDMNGVRDIFVHDRQTGETSRVSIASGGAQGNSASEDASISADGRFIAFQSASSNLVAGDAGYWDVFVHDRQSGQTSLASHSNDQAWGNEGSDTPSISPEGNFVAFRSYASNLVSGDLNGKADIFVYDRQAGRTSLISLSSGGVQGNGSSDGPVISANGRFVVYYSYASNLVSGDTNEKNDVFMSDLQSGETRLISISSTGTQGNDASNLSRITPDGRFILFDSNATNLVNGDTNGFTDVFLVHLLRWSLYLPMVRK